MASSLPSGDGIVVVWTGNAKGLHSKNHRLVKPIRSDTIGHFVLSINAWRQFGKKGQNSLAACGGQGFVEVKCNSDDTTRAPTLRGVSIGNSYYLVAAHDFHKHGRIIRMWPPKMRFDEALDPTTMATFKLTFHFSRRPREDK